MSLSMQHIEKILQPGAQALGYELVCVQMAGGDASILRVYIDHEEGVSIEDCANASRQFSAILDVEDPIHSKYTLEVSSPGIDRPLAKPHHFKSAINEKVKIKTQGLISGRRRFTGKLLNASDDSVIVDVDGEQFELFYSDMDKAQLVAQFNFKDYE